MFSHVLATSGIGIEDIWSQGPLQKPVVVMANSDAVGANYTSSVSFTVSLANDPLGTKPVYHWVMQGWSECTKECGTGKQHLILR